MAENNSAPVLSAVIEARTGKTGCGADGGGGGAGAVTSAVVGGGGVTGAGGSAGGVVVTDVAGVVGISEVVLAEVVGATGV